MYIETVNPLYLETGKGVSIKDFASYVQQNTKTKDEMEQRFFALATEYAIAKGCEVDFKNGDTVIFS